MIKILKVENENLLNLCVFNDRMFKRIRGPTSGADEEGATVEWGQQRGGGWRNSGWGSTMGLSSTSKKRHLHHKYKSPKQFELKQS